MQRRAGHDAISTTLGYVKAAEDIGGTIGEPFPPLPSSLLPSAVEAPTCRAPIVVRAEDWAKSAARRRIPGKVVGEAGFEPATTSTQSSCTTGLCDSPENS